MSLTEQGLFRWYANCCRTPIGNTPRDRKLSYLGLIHACLRAAGSSLDDSFGAVQMRVNRQGAKASAPAAPVTAVMFAGLRVVGSLAWSRVSGKYQQNPFFDAATGRPRVPPRVLSKTEHERLKATVAG